MRSLSTSAAETIPAEADFSNSASSSSDSLSSWELSTDGSMYSDGAFTDLPGDMSVRK